MDWLLRCPECGGVEVRATIRQILRYAYSSRYRRVLKELAAHRVLMGRMIDHCRVPSGNTTVQIPRLSTLTGSTGWLPGSPPTQEDE